MNRITQIISNHSDNTSDYRKLPWCAHIGLFSLRLNMDSNYQITRNKAHRLQSGLNEQRTIYLIKQIKSRMIELLIKIMITIIRLQNGFNRLTN